MLESNIFIRYFLGFWLQVVPIAALCYWAFDTQDYRLTKKGLMSLNLAVMLLFSVLQTLAWIYNEQIYSQDNEAAFTGNSMIFYIILFLCFLLFLVCVHSTFFKKLLVFSMGFTYAVFVASCANAFLVKYEAFGFWDNARETGVMLQGGSIYIILLVELVTLPLLFLFMRKMVRPVLRIMDTKTSRYLCLTIIVMLLLYCASYTKVTFDFNTVVFIFYCLTLCVFGSFGIFFFTVCQMNRSKETEEKARQLEHQLQIETLNYRNIVGNLENARMLRHNVRHHLRLIGKLAEHNNIQAIQDYIRAYDARIQSETTIQISENYILNSISQYYKSKCDESHIDLSISADLCQELDIDQVELTVLFSNILENAFNACLKVSGGRPFIDLRVGPVSGSMVIIMKNSTTMPSAKNPLTMAELQREKENGQKCLGLQSIQNIVDAHHGYLEYYCNMGVFTTKISLICVRK